MPSNKSAKLEGAQAIFESYMAKDEDLSVGIGAIMTLKDTIESTKCKTLTELRKTLHQAIAEMKATDYPVAAITSGCELFMRFITLIEWPESIEDSKKKMLERASIFLETLNKSRANVATCAQKFILDGSKILTHSKSRVVLAAMKEAAKQKKFDVYITNSDKKADKTANELRKAGIGVTEISDAAIGYVMELVDFIMVGAESVVENGGIVNKLGTYPMAICAKEMNKPFYVLTESFKFSRLFILSQEDLPEEYKHMPSMRVKKQMLDSLVDYTPPIYITLLFTDIGILTPSAVSDELIKLYL